MSQCLISLALSSSSKYLAIIAGDIMSEEVGPEGIMEVAATIGVSVDAGSSSAKILNCLLQCFKYQGRDKNKNCKQHK